MEALDQLGVAAGGNMSSQYHHKVILSPLDTLLTSVGIAESQYKSTSDALFLISIATFLLMMLVRVIFARVAVLNQQEKPRFPPSPPRWPIIGNLPQLMRGGSECHTTFRQLAEKLGPIYTVWVGSGFPLIVVTGEDTVHEALVAQGNIFSSRPRLFSWQYISAEYRTTMTSPFGPYWQKLRKIVSHDLLSPAKLASYKPIRDSEIQSMLARFQEQAEGNGGVVHPLDQLRVSAVDIIMRIGFGDDFAKMEEEETAAPNSKQMGRQNPPKLGRQNARVVELDQCFRELMDCGSIFQIMIDSSKLARFLFYFSARAAYQNIRSVAARTTSMVLPIVTHRKQQLQESKTAATESKTFVDALINLKGEDRLGDMEIVWNVVELMVGGTDNTSHILEWVLAELIHHPDIQRRAYDEVNRAMGPNLERVPVQESDLENLPFLQAVVKESMRRHMMTVLAIPKITAEDCKLRGYDIPKGTMVIFHAGSLALDREIWKDPMEFRPDRFLVSKSDSNSKLAPVDHEHKYAFMPFGAGRRSCPGAGMGLLHLHLLLANLLYAYEWLPEAAGKPVDFTEKFRMVVTMKNPLRATIKKRVHF
jgi:cytochrome P450